MKPPAETTRDEGSSPDSVVQRWVAVLLEFGSSMVGVCLGALLFVAPLAHEGVTPGGALAVEVLMATAVLMWCALRLAAPVPAPLAYRGLQWLLLGVALVVLIQAIPLPGDVAARLSATAAETVRQTWPLLAPDARPRFLPISCSPGNTLHGLLRYALVVGLLFVTRDLFRGMRRRHRFAHLMLVAGVVQVVVGVVHLLGDAATIYFLPGGPPGDAHFFGSFVSQNRNAAYLNMLWPLAAAMGIERWLASPGRPEQRSGTPVLKADGSLLDPPVYLAVAVVLVGGVLLCNSRMGWLVMGWSVLTLVALFWMRTRSALQGALFWSGSLIVGGALGFVFRQPLLALLSRLSEKPHPHLRPVIWRAAWQTALDHPWLGIGLGTFEQGFARYNPIRGYYTVLHADNTYLNLIVELGIPGALLALAAIGVGMGHVVSSKFWLRSRGQGLILGLCTALGGLLIHSFVEQTTRGYGTLVTATMAAGLLLAAIRAPEARHFDTTLRHGRTPPRAFSALLVLPLALGLAVCFGVGDLVTQQGKEAYREKRLDELVPALHVAAQVAPWAGGPVRLLGTAELFQAHRLLARSLDEDAPVARATLAAVPGHLRAAESYLSAAIVRDPLDGYAQRALSRVAQLRGERRLARALALDACRVQPSDYRNRLQLGRILEWMGRRDDALDAFGQALVLAPDPALDWLARALFDASGRNARLVGAHLPETEDWRPYQAFGMLLARIDRYPDAIPWFEKVLEREPRQPGPVSRLGYQALRHKDLAMAERASAFLMARFPEFHGGYAIRAEVLAARGQVDEAVAAMMEAAARRPPGVEEVLWAARTLAGNGEVERARALLVSYQARVPSEVRIPLARARLLWANGRRSEACEALRDAIDMHPYLEEPRYLLWKYHHAMGGPELRAEARKDLAACVALPYAPRCRFEAARVAFEAGDTGRAVALLEQAVAQDGDRAEYWRLLAEVRLAAGNREGAEEALARAEQIDPNDPANAELEARVRNR